MTIADPYHIKSCGWYEGVVHPCWRFPCLRTEPCDNREVIKVSQSDNTKVIKRVSPLALKVLLHFYVTPLRLDRNAMSDLELDALADFIADGIIEPRDAGDHDYDSHRVSAKGIVWVDAILTTPQPEHRWVMPE